MIVLAEKYKGLRFTRAYLGHREGSVATTVPYGVAVLLVQRKFAVFIEDEKKQPQRRRRKKAE